MRYERSESDGRIREPYEYSGLGGFLKKIKDRDSDVRADRSIL